MKTNSSSTGGSHTSDKKSYGYSTTISPLTAKNEHNYLFKLVSKGHVVDINWLKFVNHYFQERPPVHDTVLQSCQSNMTQIELWSTNSVNNMSHLLIRIPRMAKSGIPALGLLEIWGQPSRNCPPYMTQNALQVHQKLQSLAKISPGMLQSQKSSNDSNPNTCHSSAMEKSNNANEVKQSGVMDKNIKDFDKIPPEFIDPLTCALMTLPMLLPCGQNIDNSTLEKYNANEKLWGRSESDPFTGVSLSDVHRVVMNSNLKARIDQFVLSGVIDTRNLPRTLGSRGAEGQTGLPGTKVAIALSQGKTDKCTDILTFHKTVKSTSLAGAHDKRGLLLAGNSSWNMPAQSGVFCKQVTNCSLSKEVIDIPDDSECRSVKEALKRHVLTKYNNKMENENSLCVNTKLRKNVLNAKSKHNDCSALEKHSSAKSSEMSLDTSRIRGSGGVKKANMTVIGDGTSTSEQCNLGIKLEPNHRNPLGCNKTNASNLSKGSLVNKRRKADEILQNASKRQNKIHSPLPPDPAGTLPVVSSSYSSSKSSHEEDLSQSLDEEVQRTLQALPSFLKKTSRSKNSTLQQNHSSYSKYDGLSSKGPSHGQAYQSLQNNGHHPQSCASCRLDGKFQPLFLLPCSHLFCRTCLMSCQGVCSACDNCFSKAEVVCVHVS